MSGARTLSAALLLLAALAPAAQAREDYPKDSAEVDAAVKRLGDTMRQADDFERQGKLREAEPLWRDALAQREHLLGKRDPLVAAGMERLARNIEMQGDYKRAEPLRRSVLDLREGDAAAPQKVPEAHSALGYNLTMQGNLHEGAGQSYKAFELLRAAGRAEDADAAHALSVVGLTLDRQARYAEAEPFYRRALDIRRKALGENDLDTATSYNNLAAALSGQGRFAEAQALFETALAIREANGTVPGLVAQNALNMALNLDKLGQYGKARMLYRIAIDMWTKLYGAEHVLTADGYNGLGMSYFRQDMFGMAATELEHARSLREAALGHYSPDTGESYANLGVTLRAMGQEAEGRRMLATALDIDERTLGADHPETRAVREALASPPPSPKPQAVPMDYPAAPAEKENDR